MVKNLQILKKETARNAKKVSREDFYLTYIFVEKPVKKKKNNKKKKINNFGKGTFIKKNFYFPNGPLEGLIVISCLLHISFTSP